MKSAQNEGERRNPQQGIGVDECWAIGQRPDETAQKYRGGWMLTGARGVSNGDYLRFVAARGMMDYVKRLPASVRPEIGRIAADTHPEVATAVSSAKPTRLRTENRPKLIRCAKIRATLTQQTLQDGSNPPWHANSTSREVAFSGRVLPRPSPAR